MFIVLRLKTILVFSFLMASVAVVSSQPILVPSDKVSWAQVSEIDKSYKNWTIYFRNIDRDESQKPFQVYVENFSEGEFQAKWKATNISIFGKVVFYINGEKKETLKKEDSANYTWIGKDNRFIVKRNDKLWLELSFKKGGKVWIAVPGNATQLGLSNRVPEQPEIISGIHPRPPNQPPTISSLESDKPSPQVIGEIISWTAWASDPENNPIFYKFFLNGTAMTNWQLQNCWTWISNRTGSSIIGVQIKDSEHPSPEGINGNKSAEFRISGSIPNNPPTIAALKPDKAGPYEIEEVVDYTAYATDRDRDSIFYKFYLDGVAKTEWSEEKTWRWDTKNAKIGSHRIDVEIRDGRYAGPPEGYDDKKGQDAEIAISLKEGESIEEALVSAKEHEVSTIYMHCGKYYINKTMNIDFGPLNIIGKSKDVVIYPSVAKIDGMRILARYCTIKNISLLKFRDGIILNAENCTIVSNTISVNETAITINQLSKHVIVKDCTLSGKPGERFPLLRASKCYSTDITNNTLNQNDYGIVFANVQNSFVKDNTISSNLIGIKIKENCDNITIMHNRIKARMDHELKQSIRIDNSKNIKINGNNTIEGNPIDNGIDDNWDGNCWINPPCFRNQKKLIGNSVDNCPNCCQGG